MKLIIMMTAGIVLGIVVTKWQRPVAWILTRIPPATHPDCAPRARVWHHGKETTP